MAMVFRDKKGVLLIEYLPRGTTITAARYCDVSKNSEGQYKTKVGVSWQNSVFTSVLIIHSNVIHCPNEDTKGNVQMIG